MRRTVPNHTALKGLNGLKKKYELHYLSIAHLYLDAGATAFLPPKSRPGNDRRTPQQRQVCPKQRARLRSHGPESAKRHCKLPSSPPLTWGCYRTAALSQLHLRSCGSRRRRGSRQTTAHGPQPWGSVLPESCTVPWSTTKNKNTQNGRQHHSEPSKAGIYKGGTSPHLLAGRTVTKNLKMNEAPSHKGLEESHS